ncbi:hypothetical protein Tb09.v1.0900 [Trypanosoma brucei brucei TREU927]|uniref:Uncharacterized protein n=1 Tax=Trypanosoma brucei brucei (strain 927/4 GUTat10.1) TaxID=185431 RepID=Q38CP7_TRYB2|nr:hypothetical protein Tb09.v1.0900 [Trypanosoma brucei brucei TREU927]EAN77423.1 hypothetical protein Tb09.v1.0900 [Trypanosoma brucei brucei TREU927]
MCYSDSYQVFYSMLSFHSLSSVVASAYNMATPLRLHTGPFSYLFFTIYLLVYDYAYCHARVVKLVRSIILSLSVCLYSVLSTIFLMCFVSLTLTILLTRWHLLHSWHFLILFMKPIWFSQTFFYINSVQGRKNIQSLLSLSLLLLSLLLILLLLLL